MGEWRETTLGGVCDEVDGIIQTGPFGSQLHESDYSAEGIPVVMPKDIIEGQISTTDISRISPEHVERLRRHKLRRGDIVYGRRGDIGRQSLIKREQEGWLCGTGCLRLSLGETVLNPLFLHYYLRQEDVIAWIANHAVGATLPNLNTGILRSVPIRIPPIQVQHRIAGILSAYDDQVQNNRRRIRILEEMARLLYREWFVNFRFPGQKNQRRVTSPLGDIPAGWKLPRLLELTTKIGSGATPRGGKGAYHTKGIALIRSLNVYDYDFDFSNLAYIDDEQAIQLNNVIVEAGDVLLNITGASVARCSLVPSYIVPARVNQHVAIIRANPQCMNPFYLLDTINNEWNKQRLLGLAQGGATREALTKDTISNLLILLPPPHLISQYGELVGPLHIQREILNRQIQNLRRTRDLVLPHLFSGRATLETN